MPPNNSVLSAIKQPSVLSTKKQSNEASVLSNKRVSNVSKQSSSKTRIKPSNISDRSASIQRKSPIPRLSPRNVKKTPEQQLVGITFDDIQNMHYSSLNTGN